MVDKILSMIKSEYRLKSLDAGVFHKLVVRGMDFEINSFEAVGFGRVATMCASGLFGMVKRDILVISPLEKDAAVVTYERVRAFGKDTLLLSRDDLQNEAQHIKEVGKKKQKADFDAKVESYFADYLSEIKSAEAVNAKERQKKVEDLVTTLLEEGRLVSDIFRATYGGKITEKLYHEVMFGTR